VLVVQPVGLIGADEKLGAVGAGAGVGHGQDAGPGMLQHKVLVLELVPVDALAAGSVARREVSALAHELGDDAMEVRTVVPEALLAGAERAEVLRRPGNHIGPQGHLNATGDHPADRNVKEDNWVLCHDD